MKPLNSSHTFKPTFPNSIPINFNFNKNQPSSSCRSKPHSTFSQKSTIFLGNLSRFTTPPIIHHIIQDFGNVLGISWRKDRTIAFVKLQTTNQASSVLNSLNGKIINGMRITIGYAKNDLNLDLLSKHSSNFSQQNSKSNPPFYPVNQPAPQNSPKVNLSYNVETCNRINLTALIVDKIPMTATKLIKWFKGRSIAVESISVWGLFGYIVVCSDEDSFKRMTMGPTLSVDEFIEVIPMSQRRNKYSRIAKVAISGIPYDCVSSNCAIVAAEEVGRVLHINTNCHRLKRTDVVFALIEIFSPGPIEKMVLANVANCTTCNLWVEEINYDAEIEIISDEDICIYNSWLQKTNDAVDNLKSDRILDSPVTENLNPPVVSPVVFPDVETEVTVIDPSFQTPQKVIKKVEIHNSLEKVTSALLSQKAKNTGSNSAASEIKRSLFKSFDKDGLSDNVENLKQVQSGVPPHSQKSPFSLSHCDYPILKTTSPKNQHFPSVTPPNSRPIKTSFINSNVSFADKVNEKPPSPLKNSSYASFKASHSDYDKGSREAILQPIVPPKKTDKNKSYEWINKIPNMTDMFDTTSEINHLTEQGLDSTQNIFCNKKIPYKEELYNFGVFMENMPDDTPEKVTKP